VVDLEDALRDIIRYYTREAACHLEREIANLARQVDQEILMRLKRSSCRVAISRSLPAVRRYRSARPSSKIWSASHRLAWTEVGGEILTIEAVTVPGKGKVTATGSLATS